MMATPGCPGKNKRSSMPVGPLWRLTLIVAQMLMVIVAQMLMLIVAQMLMVMVSGLLLLNGTGRVVWGLKRVIM